MKTAVATDSPDPRYLLWRLIVLRIVQLLAREARLVCYAYSVMRRPGGDPEMTAMPTSEQIKAMGTAEFDALVAEFAARERQTGLGNVGRCDRTRWCGCPDTSGAESYYETADHRHGWFHDPAMGGCGAVTQTG